MSFASSNCTPRSWGTGKGCATTRCQSSSSFRHNFAAFQNFHNYHLRFGVYSRPSRYRRHGRNSWTCSKRNTLAAAATINAENISLQNLDQLLKWCIEFHSLPATALEPALVDTPGGGGRAQRFGFTVSRAIEQGDVSLQQLYVKMS